MPTTALESRDGDYGPSTPVLARPVDRTCTLTDLNHCWVGGRSGKFNHQMRSATASGVQATLTRRRRMLAFWSAATNVERD